MNRNQIVHQWKLKNSYKSNCKITITIYASIYCLGTLRATSCILKVRRKTLRSGKEENEDFP